MGFVRRSAFRTKGLVYQGAFEFYDQRVPGGTKAVFASLEPDLRDFVTQPIIAGGWYDVLPLVPLSAAAAGLAATPHPRLVRENARWLARRDIHGVYRFLLRLASPEMVAARLPRVAIQYFDFGGASGELEGPGLFRARQTKVPAPLADWLLWCVEGFVPVALETAGAKQVTVRSLGTEPDGTRAGVVMMTMAYEIRWA